MLLFFITPLIFSVKDESPCTFGPLLVIFLFSAHDKMWTHAMMTLLCLSLIHLVSLPHLSGRSHVRAFGPLLLLCYRLACPRLICSYFIPSTLKKIQLLHAPLDSYHFKVNKQKELRHPMVPKTTTFLDHSNSPLPLLPGEGCCYTPTLGKTSIDHYLNLLRIIING